MVFFYSFALTTGLIRIFCSGFLVAYGVPAYYWLKTDANTDQQKYKRRFIKTYVWLTGIWWFLMVLFWVILILALSSIGSGVTDA